MKSRILYIYNLNVSFILKDISILEKEFDVQREFADTSNAKRLVRCMLRQFIRLPGRVRSADLVVIFFAGYHSVIPVLLGRLIGRPVLLVLGGSDCYWFPSIDYGNYRKPLMRIATALSIRYATHVSSVHETLVESEYTYSDNDFRKQGYRAFVRGVHTPETTIYLEFDPGLFPYRASPPAPRTFLTLGYGMDGNTFRRKGVDLIVELANRLPDCRFSVVGSNNPALHAGAPANVRFLRPVPYEDLKELYQTHQYYLQLSMAEGFPSAICEAMLCGCIPIGSGVAAIPYIVGDTGFVLEKKDIDALLRLCRNALTADVDALSRKARARIMEICAPGSRASKLTQLVKELISGAKYRRKPHRLSAGKSKRNKPGSTPDAEL